MAIVAACLKVKINNQEAKLNSFVDLNFNNLSDISTEQLAVVRLLKNYFGGIFRWSHLLPDPEQPNFGGGVIGDMGSIGGEPADKSGFYIGTIDMREYPFSFAAFNEQRFRSAIGDIEDVLKISNFYELVNAASLDDLQQLIDDEINSSNPKYTVTVHTEPVTMSILRCTQSDINSIAVDGAPPHVDMFDSLVQMLPHHSPTLDKADYAPAYYDARLDQIVFKSKFGFHQKIAGSDQGDLTGFLLLAYSTIGSDKYRSEYDVSKTTEPTWNEYFSKTLNIANINYTHVDSGTQAESNAPYEFIDFFDINSVLRVYAYNGTGQNDIANLSLEILDANNNVLAAIKVERVNSFRNELYYGNSLTDLIKTGTTGTYPQTNGDLSFTESGMIYYNLAPTNFNDSFQFDVDLTSATKVRVFGYAKAEAIRGNGSAGAYIRILP